MSLPEESGEICRWQDARGTGYIRTARGTLLFVHIRAFVAPCRRPRDGDTVRFRRALHAGKPCADGVRLLVDTAMTAGRRHRPWLAVLFFAVLGVLAWCGVLPRDVLMLYALSSLLAVLMYHRDKLAARHGRWRTPERTLHWLALLGGWPGAQLAQYWFRHKSAKPSFRRWFWLTVLLNLLLLGYGLYRGEALLASLR